MPSNAGEMQHRQTQQPRSEGHGIEHESELKTSTVLGWSRVEIRWKRSLYSYYGPMELAY